MGRKIQACLGQLPRQQKVWTVVGLLCLSRSIDLKTVSLSIIRKRTNVTKRSIRLLDWKRHNIEEVAREIQTTGWLKSPLSGIELLAIYYHPGLTVISKVMLTDQLLREIKPPVKLPLHVGQGPLFDDIKRRYPYLVRVFNEGKPPLVYQGSEAGLSRYIIPKGTILYHGTCATIKNDHFDRRAFFSFNREVSISIMTINRRFFTNTARSVKFHDCWLYSLVATRDIHLVYNRHMGKSTPYGYEMGPQYSVGFPQTMTQFCQSTGDDGWWSWRDAAPIPPILKQNFNQSPEITKEIIKRLQQPDLNWMIRKYLITPPQRYRNEPVITPEIVLCQPHNVLQVVKKEPLNGQQEIERIRQSAIDLLSLHLHDKTIPLRELRHRFMFPKNYFGP